MLTREIRISAREIDLTTVVQSAVHIVRPSAIAKHIQIDAALDGDVGPVRADHDRMQQVVLNLLNNAVKFTPDGGRVSVWLRRAGAGGAVEIQVADSGRGISPEFLPHVFERFSQADSSHARAQGGLGLGLAIARELVELHGGTMRAESPGIGKGATFTVELPVARTPPEQPSEDRSVTPGDDAWQFVPSPVLRGVRVLVVEDEPVSREVIEYLLQACEAEVTAVESAADALRQFEARIRERPFDVLLSDLGLPEIDGCELMRQIRAMEQRTGRIEPTPAVALTAYARERDRAESQAAGFNTHLTKPLVATVLVRTVADGVGRSTHH
jgi:CheY-like chemotaxis protein